MLTKEKLEQASTKARLTAWHASMQQRLKNAGEEEAKAVRSAIASRRHPDTIVGVLTREQVDERLKNLDPDSLLANGLAVISDDKAFFLSDDQIYGHGALPVQFMGGTFPIPLGTCDGVFATCKEFTDYYFKGRRYLASLDEIVAYVNANYNYARVETYGTST